MTGANYVEDTTASDGFYGTPVLGIRRDTDATTVSADGDYEELQLSSTGRLKVDAPFAPSASYGATQHYKLNSAATTNRTLISSAPRNVNDVEIFNTSASLIYFKMYNKNSINTSADVPVKVFPVNSGDKIIVPAGTFGWRFSSGLGFAIVLAAADTDDTAVATGVFVNISYT